MAAARPRKPLDPDSTDLVDRFALQLRKTLDANHLSIADVANSLSQSGLPTSDELVKKWLSADRFPRPNHLEALGQLLFDDYRDVLPPPIRPGQRKR